MRAPPPDRLLGVLVKDYRIARPDEETGCEWCGYPLYVGNSAIMTARENVVCGSGCARKLEAAERSGSQPNNGKG